MELIVDIETCGGELESLADSQQEFLLRYAGYNNNDEQNETKIDEIKRHLSLYPFTAEIVAVSLLNIKSEKIVVMCNSKVEEEVMVEEKKTKYNLIPEKEILQTFWDYIENTTKVITFNGRCFDIPFLMLRSAMLNIRPSKNLIGNRYDNSLHIDLLDQFTFHGLTRKFNIDFYCHAFGIESPKSRGITGMEVKELFRAGRIKELGVYCADDVRATHELYKIWKTYLDIH